ncbi:MAG: hypothetical protein RIS94_768 [Pseudomonadota bacterium]
MKRLQTSAPVNFVFTTPFDRAALEAAPSFEHHAIHDEEFRTLLSSKGDICWEVATYFHLRERGYEGIELSGESRPGCINVIHSELLRRAGADPGRFEVSVQADFAYRPSAHYHVLQNADFAGGNRETIWLYPQAGIVPRSAPEGRMKRIGYLGHVHNNLVWRHDRWQAFLDPLGLEFVAPPASQWHDFADLDAVVAIRSFSKARFSSKPPSKLINAWIAGVPFIGGSDSAYRQIGTPGEDFLVATNPDEVRAAIARLQNEPGLVAKLVSNGRERAREFTVDRLVDKWIALLEGPVEQRYRLWQSRPRYEALRVQALWGVDRFIGQGKRAYHALRGLASRKG